MRALILIFALVLTGCITPSAFYGPAAAQRWMRRALAHPGEDPAARRFYRAYRDEASGLHDYLAEVLKQSMAPEIDQIARAELGFKLETILRHLGDQRFAQALSAEPPEVVSAVAMTLHLPGSSLYPETSNDPKTLQLLNNAPRIDWPSFRASHGLAPRA